MVGGGNRRDEASFTVSNTNVFAALESLRKKKKSDKDKSSSRGGKGKAAGSEAEKQVFWAPAPLTVKSWADVDDEDDDDYYATTAPPQAIWAGSRVNTEEETHKPDLVEESESEDDLLDEEDDDVDEVHDQEPEVEDQPEPLEKPVEASPAPKETERQLSKKERRKKELAELEAILADFGVNPKEKAEDEPSDVTKDVKEGESNGNGSTDKKDNPPMESKSAKKKKKKASKEVQPISSDLTNGQDETEHVEEDASAVDVKERLKKVAYMKKKKSSKEVDSGARAAATEAAARSARLAAAKKKEKNHYNQQPMR